MMPKAALQRNKELTKRKLIDAVGQLLDREGYRGLGVNKIAKQAAVNKKLIYRYFWSLNNLIESYVSETDFWLIFSENLKKLEVPNDHAGIKAFLTASLQAQFNHFQSNQQLQQLILWELSAKSEVMNSIHRTREMLGEQLLDKVSQYFQGTYINFRAIAALMVGGIYYTILHTRHNGSMFGNVDLSASQGKEEMLTAIEQILDYTFEHAVEKRETAV